MNNKLLSAMRVLVVEDEFYQAEHLKQILIAAGANFVRLSGQIEDATREAKKQAYSFVLVDVNVQGERSFPIADHLLMTGVPFGFVTGYERSALPPRFADSPYWRKPINPPAFVQDIHRICFGSAP